MKHSILLLVPTLCLMALAHQSSGTLTGTWVGPASTADNGLEMTVALNQSLDGSLTGYILGRLTEPIVAGKAQGEKLSFDTERPARGGNGAQKVTYTAVIEGDKMNLSLPVFRRPTAASNAASPPPPPRQVVALTRVSTAAPGPMPARPALISLPMPAQAVPYDGLSKTPPMGWNSWNKFRNQVSDKVVREIADAMVASGMKDAGYIYLNIDDTWESAHRDAQGNIATNNKFPDMKALADYVHSKGLKLGIYSSPGPKTCAGYLGSYQHEEQDAKTYASWGIDYLKYDWCSAREVYANDQATMIAAYTKMGNALANSGRNIVFSLCQYGMLDVGEWGARVDGNLWRTTGDISDHWESMSHIGFDLQPGREKYAAPGHWNDPDMLEIGNGGMTDDEYKTHMSLWSILAAPLLAGNDIRSMTTETAAVLLNKEVIAIDQDPLGKQGTRVTKNGDLEIWSRPLANGGLAVGLFNRGAATADITARWSELGLQGSHAVRDLWQHKDLGKQDDSFSANVPSHGVVMVIVN